MHTNELPDGWDVWDDDEGNWYVSRDDGSLVVGVGYRSRAQALDVTRRVLAEQRAYELGAEHARNAASWTVDNLMTADDARRLLDRIDDGDPTVWVGLPEAPNLSGEWADDMTPARLMLEVVGPGADDAAREALVDALCDAYELGVSETFEPAVAAELEAIAAEPAGTTPVQVSDSDMRAIYSAAITKLHDIARSYEAHEGPHATRDNARRLAAAAQALHAQIGR